MILSFADRDTAQLFHEEKNRRHAPIVRVALRKLIQLNRAGQLSDMAVPPGNRLEALQGSWRGLYSIRINNQWRIVFRWTKRGPAEVGIKDYH
jgi:toxin HigB-1